MGEMEDKLNAILNDPSAMGQIMALAQSLGGGAPRPQASPAGEAAQGAEQTGAREAEAPASAGSAPPALTGGEEPLAALGEIDPGMIQMGMRLLREYQGEDDRTVALLNALRPFLKESRLAKLDRAVQISRLARVIRVLPRHGRRGAGRCITAISPRMVLIPGWWSRTARRRGPGVRHPIRPGRSGGSRGRTGPGAPQDLHPGQPGARPEEEAAGLPRVPWALAAWGTCSQGRRAR